METQKLLSGFVIKDLVNGLNPGVSVVRVA